MNEPVEHTYDQDEPIYNIGVVARMTAIQETTLRIWERRYGFPRSARTSGGHRLYSPTEVTRLHWVKAQVDRGMQISQAIRALELAENEGRFPDLLRPALASAPAYTTPAATFATFRDRLVQALTAHDSDLADHLIGAMLAAYSVEDIVLHIIIPTFTVTGEAWAQGQISIATEHFATNYLRHRLLLWMQTGPSPYSIGPVVLACAPDEWHEGSLLVLGALLRRLRWPVTYLGQAVPLADLAGLAHATRPSAVVLVAMTAKTARTLKEWPRHLPEAAESDRPPVCFGGRAFAEDPALAESVPGVFLGATLPEGLEKLNRLLHEMNPLVR